MRTPTRFICTFSVNGKEEAKKEGPNKFNLLFDVKKILKEKVGKEGIGNIEIRKVYTDGERKKMSIPDNIHGIVEKRITLKNGKWMDKTPFKEYF
jgi:hypothetical protein